MTLTYRGQQYDQTAQVKVQTSNLQYRGVKYEKVSFGLYGSVRVAKEA